METKKRYGVNGSKIKMSARLPTTALREQSCTQLQAANRLCNNYYKYRDAHLFDRPNYHERTSTVEHTCACLFITIVTRYVTIIHIPTRICVYVIQCCTDVRDRSCFPGENEIFPSDRSTE